MTKEAAVQAFFESFGIPAFPEAYVPTSGDDMPQFPYITYSVPMSAEMSEVTATASVWYRTESWVGVNAKAEQISQEIGLGKLLVCDNGAIILRRGETFAQQMVDASDDMVKRQILQIYVKFITTY